MILFLQGLHSYLTGIETHCLREVPLLLRQIKHFQVMSSEQTSYQYKKRTLHTNKLYLLRE